MGGTPRTLPDRLLARSGLARVLADAPVEGARQPWLRWIGAVAAIAAGAIHLAQIGIHAGEGWEFVAFFAVVGVIQVGGGLMLVWPWPAGWFWFGIGGSAAVIVIWLISRSLGVPFGAEPGQAEQLGMADAAASLFEAITIVVLALWLRSRSRAEDRAGYVMGIGALLGIGILWAGARALGAFAPDPRLTGAPPELADRAALPAIAAVVVSLVLLGFSSPGTGWWRSVLRGLLLALLISSGALVFLTLPASGGQNAGCQYGPLAEVSGLSHATPPAPVALEAGQERWLPVLLLTACGTDAVYLDAAEPLHTRGVARVEGFALLPDGLTLPNDGSSKQPDGSLSLSTRPPLRPGEKRQLAVLLRAGSTGFNLDSVRVRYAVGTTQGSFGFASFLALSPPGACGS